MEEFAELAIFAELAEIWQDLQFIAGFVCKYHFGKLLGSTPRALANLIRVERFGFFILPER